MPDWRREIRERLAGLSPARVDEIADELAQHLEDRYSELMAGGLPEPEAWRTTLHELEVLGKPGPGGGGTASARPRASPRSRS